MKYYSLNRQSPPVDFKEATLRGQAPDNGLYFPERSPKLNASMVKNMETLPNEEIAFEIIRPYVDGVIADDPLFSIVSETVHFPIPLVKLSESLYSLELFHGPTLAFKDVGARFMSRCLSFFANDSSQKVIVLVATSGDTGGAVAHSFYGADHVEVVILYPSGKVSPLQQKQLTTLGRNIHALEINGDFDDCQQMVKQAFADPIINQKLFLTSANSINVARWLPQQFYYAFLWKQWPFKEQPPVIAVPSGNFGNICAGILAYQSGIPVTAFLAACNANDVIPRFFRSGVMENQAAVPTISNAMDVAKPSNFIRILELLEGKLEGVKKILDASSTDDAATRNTIRKVFKKYNYVLDPHSAVAFHALEEYITRRGDPKGVFISTAHPVKFPEIVEQEIGQPLMYPPGVEEMIHRPSFHTEMSADYNQLKEFLLGM